MAAAKNKNIPAQSSGDVLHTISQEDLDLNPDLIEEGVEVGEEVGLGEEVLGDELPLGGTQEQIGLYKVVTPFRDKNDFSIEYNEDSGISHLEKDRIDHLLNIGYIQPLEAE